MLAVFRFILGLGMGGEWNTGATLVARNLAHRIARQSNFHCAKLLGNRLCLRRAGCRNRAALRGLAHGILRRHLTALVTLWIQSSVPESRMWEEQHRLSEKRSSHPGMVPGSLNVEHTSRRGQEDASFAQIFRSPYLKKTLALLFVNFLACSHGGDCLPGFLHIFASRLPRRARLRRHGHDDLLIVLNLAGMFPGYASFGWVADRLGRRKSFIVYTFMASLLVPLYAIARQPAALLVLGTVVAFFGTGFFSGSGIIGVKSSDGGSRSSSWIHV